MRHMNVPQLERCLDKSVSMVDHLLRSESQNQVLCLPYNKTASAFFLSTASVLKHASVLINEHTPPVRATPVLWPLA